MTPQLQAILFMVVLIGFTTIYWLSDQVDDHEYKGDGFYDPCAFDHNCEDKK